MTSSGPKNIRNSSPVFFLSHRSYSNTHTHLSQVSISQHMDNQTDRSFFNQDVISTTPGPEPQRQRSVIHLSHFFSGASEPSLSPSLTLSPTHTHFLLNITLHLLSALRLKLVATRCFLRAHWWQDWWRVFKDKGPRRLTLLSSSLNTTDRMWTVPWHVGVCSQPLTCFSAAPGRVSSGNPGDEAALRDNYHT